MPDPRDFLPPPPWEGPPLPAAFLRAFNLTPDRIDLIQRLNDLIRQRTRYGLRTETVEEIPAYRLSWSNASAEWWVHFGAHRRRGEQVTLDANEILAQGVHKSDLNAVTRWLEPLPLYRFSFEAKLRGFFDPLGWLKALFESWLEEREE